MQNQTYAADTLYATLSPHAPAFVRAPALVFAPAPIEPSRLEVLRCQIAAAQAARATTGRWR